MLRVKVEFSGRGKTRPFRGPRRNVLTFMGRSLITYPLGPSFKMPPSLVQSQWVYD